MTELRIRAFGRPAPQGSHEVGANGHVMHASPYLAAWRQQVKIAVFEAYRAAGLGAADLPLYPSGAVHVRAMTLIVDDAQCRAAGTDEPVGRPDLDKLLRATIDGLGDARLFVDDAQVLKVYELSKTRSSPGMPPGALIIVSNRPPTQGESMTKRYELALMEIDESGERKDILVVNGNRQAVAAMLPHISTELDAPAAPDVAEEPAGAESATAEAPKRGRGRPRKSTPAPAAEAPAGDGPTGDGDADVQAAAEAAGASTPTDGERLAEHAEQERQAARGDEVQPEAAPAAPAARVNPFARG